jgi:hypothetical protein
MITARNDISVIHIFVTVSVISVEYLDIFMLIDNRNIWGLIIDVVTMFYSSKSNFAS